MHIIPIAGMRQVDSSGLQGTTARVTHHLKLTAEQIFLGLHSVGQMPSEGKQSERLGIKLLPDRCMDSI